MVFMSIRQFYFSLLLLLALLISFKANAQEWAPTGAQWTYGLLVSPVAGPWQDYIVFESENDTLLAGKNAKVIGKTRYYFSGGSSYEGIEIMYSDSNRVYYWMSSQFHLLYDFSADTNDTWDIRIPYELYGMPLDTTDSMRTITVDSASSLIVNNDTLKILYVTASDNPVFGFPDWYFGNPLIERIGANYMFPGIWGLWDLDIPYLRCYDEIGLSYKKYDSIACDTLITFIPDRSWESEDGLTVFPNPFNDFITIQIESKVRVKEGEMTISNYLGQPVFFRHLEKDENAIVINISNLNNGLYLINLRINSEKYTYKLIKQ